MILDKINGSRALTLFVYVADKQTKHEEENIVLCPRVAMSEHVTTRVSDSNC